MFKVLKVSHSLFNKRFYYYIKSMHTGLVGKPCNLALEKRNMFLVPFLEPRPTHSDKSRPDSLAFAFQVTNSLEKS